MRGHTAAGRRIPTPHIRVVGQAGNHRRRVRRGSPAVRGSRSLNCGSWTSPRRVAGASTGRPWYPARRALFHRDGRRQNPADHHQNRQGHSQLGRGVRRDCGHYAALGRQHQRTPAAAARCTARPMLLLPPEHITTSVRIRSTRLSDRLGKLPEPDGAVMTRRPAHASSPTPNPDPPRWQARAARSATVANRAVPARPSLPRCRTSAGCRTLKFGADEIRKSEALSPLYSPKTAHNSAR